ncbi:MAG: hypothetical protein WCO60_18940 [Verrucomicrobiota bacterium]
MEALSADFVSVLRCPVTRGPLRWIPRGLWEGLEVGETGMAAFEQTVSGWEGGLMREDGEGMYPVRGGIPVLLAEEFVKIPEILRPAFCG